ncbi:MAG: hypothetical protein JSU86_12640 [Phycisphaerales bacterium]|nr:MAG: hypothetical protein JSU86_12640 [Phycisphaerales bacterium]
MKAFIALLVLIGLGWVVLYYAGGYGSFDPSEQGRQARAALRPGMPFGQACDITGDPKYYRIINRKVRRINGQEVAMMVPAPPVKCTRDRISQRLAEGSLPYGFTSTFTYSTTVAFTVTYDDTGAVKKVVDAVTMADWME